ncbi:hypothetical protein JL722_14287 [Aureococcus anophagefferens]|nr:hypothetical protein JL722_14287 [Aureococcus anophagefferens]
MLARFARTAARPALWRAPRAALSYPAHEVVGLPALSPTMEMGTIAAWKVDEGGAFGAGDVIAEIETDKATVDFEAQDDGVLAKILVQAGTERRRGVAGSAVADAFLLMPAAAHLANSKGIDVTSLAGSGKGGRITKGDVLTAPPATSTMRKVIAKRLTESRAYVPHGFTTMSADLAAVGALRKSLAADYGVKVSVNDVVIKAAALASRPARSATCRANSSWDGATCVPNASVDISVAVATPSGLITPIVTDAAGKGLTVISSEPEEFQGGTFTVSNLGMFGISEFSAVVNPPQACILAVGGGVNRVKSDGAGGAVGVTEMTSRLSSDRRVVDEPTAAQFMQAFAYYIAHPKLLVL